MATIAEQKRADALVRHYEANRAIFEASQGALLSLITANRKIMDNVHFVKSRLKDPEHLRAKLLRKFEDAKKKKGKPFNCDSRNLFTKINDLIGLRLIHLSRRQLSVLHPAILLFLKEYKYKVLEVFARTWDDESRSFYKDMQIKVQTSPNMYTSVHYVIRSNTGTTVTAEIQVRTLAEELWGEVDHMTNYPTPSTNKSCKAQIRVLARLVSTCTRLVDSIDETSKDGGSISR